MIGTTVRGLKCVRASTDGKFKDEKSRGAESLMRYLGAPFSLNVFRMNGFLTAKNVSIRSVSRVRARTRQMLKVELEMRPFRKGAMSFEGWFTVSPDEAWVITEHEYVDQGKISVHGSIEYRGMQTGFPVPRRFARTATKLNKLLSSQTYDFEKLVFVDVPDRDFTLSAFGLPEVARPAESSVAGPGTRLVAFSLLALRSETAVSLLTTSTYGCDLCLYRLCDRPACTRRFHRLSGRGSQRHFRLLSRRRLFVCKAAIDWVSSGPVA